LKLIELLFVSAPDYITPSGLIRVLSFINYQLFIPGLTEVFTGATKWCFVYFDGEVPKFGIRL